VCVYLYLYMHECYISSILVYIIYTEDVPQLRRSIRIRRDSSSLQRCIISLNTYIYMWVCVYMYIVIYMNVICSFRLVYIIYEGGAPWPLHDIVITNIVWCLAYKRAVGRGVVYCPRIVEQNCTRLGNAAGRGGLKGRLTRAQQPRSKGIPCKC